MAVINKYSKDDEVAIVPVTLEGTDTVTLTLNGSSTLYITNDTAAELDINILGDTATAKVIAGYGSLDLTTGLTFTVPVGEMSIPLNTKYRYWLGDGNLTITGGTDCTAYVIEG